MKTLSRWLAVGALLALASGAWGSITLWDVQYTSTYDSKFSAPVQIEYKSGSLSPWATTIAYCVDRYSDIQVPSTHYGVETSGDPVGDLSNFSTPSGAPNTHNVAPWVLQANASDLWFRVSYVASVWGTQAQTVHDDWAVATQLAIFTTLGQYTDLNADKAKLTTTALSHYQSIIDFLSSHTFPVTPVGPATYINRVVNTPYWGQALVVASPPPAGSVGAVPEASSLLLLLPGLLPLGLLARKRSKA